MADLIDRELIAPLFAIFKEKDTLGFTPLEILNAVPTVETPKWIPVTERMPEEVGNYLVIWHDDEGTYMDIMWRYPDGNFTFEISLLDWWMPLPEMPEVEE